MEEVSMESWFLLFGGERKKKGEKEKDRARARARAS
jgi:hypothetical protein